MLKLRELSAVPAGLKGSIEITAWLLVIGTANLLVFLGVLSEEGCVWVATLLLLGIFLASWKAFEGGRHPCFLFLGMLLVFQGGRLIAHILGALPNPMQIAVATPVPFTIGTRAAEITLLMLVISAICIYIPCRLSYRTVVFEPAAGDRWLLALYLLIFITFPLAFYKNWIYFSFIRSHGGYLAVFTDNAEIIQSAGSFVRAIALINGTALLVAYVLERRTKRIVWVLVLYFSLSILDLLIGFRGKFFSQALVLWYIHKLKKGRGFNLLPLVSTATIASILAVIVAGLRQDQSIRLLSPVGFLAQQGASLNVTEAAVAFHHLFHRFAVGYLWGGFRNGISPITTTERGHLWTADLSMFLNPFSARLGFGTGSSYLAELFLFAGVPAVIIGSLAVGIVIATLHKSSFRPWGGVFLVLVLPTLIYLPRLEMLNPLAVALKSLGAVAVLFVLVLPCQALVHIVRRASGVIGVDSGRKLAVPR